MSGVDVQQTLQIGEIRCLRRAPGAGKLRAQ
jgi:hypothetical protein